MKINQHDIEAAREAREERIQLAKADLGRYRKANADVRCKRSLVAIAEAKTQPRAVRPKTLAPGVPDQTSNPQGNISRSEDSVCDWIEARQQLQKVMDDRDEIRRELEQRIKTVSCADPEAGHVLHLRHIELLKWGAIQVGYCRAEMFRLYRKALEAYAKNLRLNETKRD